MTTADRIDVLFNQVLARFFTIPARRPVSGNVTFAQMRILWILELQGACPLSRVAQTAGISNSTATELADRLAAGDYVRRERSAADRRQVILALRPNGRKMLEEFAQRRRERFEKLLRVVNRSDVARLAAALETVNEIVGKWPREGS
jgi:DNA-binding MarR family transcriptional regulator